MKLLKFISICGAITALTAAICAYFGQTLLALVQFNRQWALLLIVLAGGVLFLTRWLDQKLALQSIGMGFFIRNSQADKPERCAELPFAASLLANTLLAHLTGMSVGREGVAVQIGGSVGNWFSRFYSDNPQAQRFLIRLGMTVGFAALFQTPLAATLFIVEICGEDWRSQHTWLELSAMVPLALLSSYLSHRLGLEKFFVWVPTDLTTLALTHWFALIGFTFAALATAYSFIRLQRYCKQVFNLAPNYRYIGFAMVLALLIATGFRYNSLGTNLIQNSFSAADSILSHDFAWKLILTAICTALGFKGGEITPLFAIGASLGVAFASSFGLPIILFAALGYCLLFAGATRTYLAPILLGLEVFGWQVALWLVLPCLIIRLLPRWRSIYN